MSDDQLVFRALADPTRRALLDSLFARDGQTLGELSTQFAEMTRFGVGKHLVQLAEADLVTTERVGRSKLHFLNPVPVARVADRWVSKYAARFTDALLDLEHRLVPAGDTRSSPPVPPTQGATVAAHVYQIYVRASPEQVWRAITDSDWTERWFHGTRFDGPLRLGPYRTHLVAAGAGAGAVDGVVQELQPPSAGQPGRLVQTWHILYDAELGAEPPGRVEWTVGAAGDGLTLLRLVHDGLEDSPRTSAEVEDGWVWVLDSLKTLLETGEPLPAVSRAG